SSADATVMPCRFACSFTRDESGGRRAFAPNSAAVTGFIILVSRPNAFARRTAKSQRLIASAPARWYTPPFRTLRSFRIPAAKSSARVGDPIQSVTTLIGFWPRNDVNTHVAKLRRLSSHPYTTLG